MLDSKNETYNQFKKEYILLYLLVVKKTSEQLDIHLDVY